MTKIVNGPGLGWNRTHEVGPGLGRVQKEIVWTQTRLGRGRVQKMNKISKWEYEITDLHVI